MASLRGFARRIRARGRQVDTNVSRGVRATAVAVNQTLISSTPVDTGRARANWQVGVGSPLFSELPDTDPSGAATTARNNAAIATSPPREDIFISNNLPYIGRLNEGSSAQAPAGFVERAVQVAVAAIRRTRIFD